MRRRLPALALAAVLLALPSAARADRALVVTSGNQLIAFDTNAPAAGTTTIAVSGLGFGEVLKGIDFRPATGQLYGVAVPSGAVGETVRTYTLDPATGAATFLGQSSNFLVADVPAEVSFDPVIDRARYVDDTGNNTRLRPTDGTSVLPTGDSDLDPTLAPDVIALAYDRSFAGANLSSGYAIDRTESRLDLLGGADGYPPATRGAVTPIGQLGVSLGPAADAGFDISVDGRAFAAMTDGVTNVTGLYRIDLSSGAATSIGTIGTGQLQALSLALVPGTETIPTPPDAKRPVALIDLRAKLKLKRLLAGKVGFRFSVSEACKATAALTVGKTAVAAGSASFGSPAVGSIRFVATKAGKKLLAGKRRAKARLTLTLTDTAGNVGTARARALLE